MLEVARENGLEGIVAKDPDSPYLPGTRASSWIKTPLRRTTEGVVVGWILREELHPMHEPRSENPCS